MNELRTKIFKTVGGQQTGSFFKGANLANSLLTRDLKPVVLLKNKPISTLKDLNV